VEGRRRKKPWKKKEKKGEKGKSRPPPTALGKCDGYVMGRKARGRVQPRTYDSDAGRPGREEGKKKKHYYNHVKENPRREKRGGKKGTRPARLLMGADSNRPSRGEKGKKGRGKRKKKELKKSGIGLHILKAGLDFEGRRPFSKKRGKKREKAGEKKSPWASALPALARREGKGKRKDLKNFSKPCERNWWGKTIQREKKKRRGETSSLGPLARVGAGAPRGGEGEEKTL